MLIKQLDELLRIDCKETAERIEKHIRDAVLEHKVSGIIMGISGGVDSALLSTLAVRALGKERVHVYHLHDRNSEKDSEEKARLMAEWLGLKLNMESIEERMREKEKGEHFFKFISVLPPFFIPLLNSMYYLVVGETPYLTVLRNAQPDRSRFKRWIYDHVTAGIEKMFDAPCEERRIFLEEIARRENLLLIGTGNRSEDMLGWFTPKGIDNMPVSPIKCLYKAQVWQLAQYLKIPEAIRDRESSADVLRGATDTIALGMSFDRIDIVLYGIEKNMSDEDIMKHGIIKSEIRKVREIHRLSACRREA